jgi:hypothetical protein
MCHYMTLSNMESGVPCIATGTIRFIFFSNIIKPRRSTGQILTPFVDNSNDEKNKCLLNRLRNDPTANGHIMQHI